MSVVSRTLFAVTALVLFIMWFTWHGYSRGDSVEYVYFVKDKPDVCADGDTPSELHFYGTVVDLDGGKLRIRWEEIRNPFPAARCGEGENNWKRGTDAGWNNKYLGDEKTAPSYFMNLPTVLDYSQVKHVKK